jgi:hypothetical protein
MKRGMRSIPGNPDGDWCLVCTRLLSWLQVCTVQWKQWCHCLELICTVFCLFLSGGGRADMVLQHCHLILNRWEWGTVVYAKFANLNKNTVCLEVMFAKVKNELNE